MVGSPNDRYSLRSLKFGILMPIFKIINANITINVIILAIRSPNAAIKMPNPLIAK
ncbi:hypothetical protein GCM10025861_20370 [Methanobacterium petrolearium]|nr:hypothetical protein GCM10025861_20370 [Methanobacterium petrolearium]